ncbi:unnamed protein product [Vicia faba]|uniref:Uncharacterized protein n=1 Tax=Vicia faba TaxID=3906 RepID=A0AAV1AQC7_VICFA|nr:unnamed protein product [Vicia faba]
MDNRTRLRVQNKKPIKRSGKKPLVKQLLDYLKSDTFLYAPLISPQPCGFPSTNAFKVVELKKPMKKRHWFKEYIKCQGYMYDTVLELPLSSQAGSSPMNVNKQQDNDLGNMNQRSENHFSPTRLSDRLTREQKETLKHVYQTCRTTSASGNVSLNSQLRAHT